MIGGFKPLFRALSPEQTNALTGQLNAALEGQGPTIGSFLNQAAAFTNTLADRDQLISEVVTNLNAVPGTLGGQSAQLDKAVTNLSSLIDGLNARREDRCGLRDSSAAGASIADLLSQARGPFQKVVQTDRVSAIAVARPRVSGQAARHPCRTSTGRWAARVCTATSSSFYLCDLVLKLNGKGGQPVYVKVAGQDTRRCTPK